MLTKRKQTFIVILAWALIPLAAVAPALAQFEPPAKEAKGGAVLRVIGPKSIYAKAGLISDDQVISIDNLPITSAGEVGRLLYEKVGDGKSHRMLIRRDGAEKVLTFR
jgi:S1-C subfamily serine protease